MKDNRNYQNPLWLIREYVHNERFIHDIADECGTAYSTIDRWINKFGIGKKENNPIDQRYKNYDWMYDNFITQNKTAKKIAKELNIHITTVNRSLKRMNIRKKELI